MTEQPPEEPGEPSHEAESVRGGEIVLRKRWQRVIFGAGLVLAVVIAILLRVAAG